MALIQQSVLSRFMFGIRPFVIGFLILIFLIPLHMVTGVISDRIANHRVAVEDIASSWARSQNLFGPVITVPYTETVSSEQYNPQTKQLNVISGKVERSGFYIPDHLKIAVKWKTEEKARGIHKVPVYTAAISLSGNFKDVIKDARVKGRELGTPYLSVAVSDIRGIGAVVDVKLNNETRMIEPGSKITSLPGGFHVPLPAGLASGPVSFDIHFELKGLNSFAAVPVGNIAEMEGSADWPHPSFKGQFLPDEKEITDSGFTAKWKTGLLATNILEQASACIRNEGNQCENMWQNSFGVQFFQPVDIYTQSMRAAKYGILFVTLTFAIFYISEILQGARVYTMQLFLIGFALAIFYLLLVSLSEFAGFAIAYLLASIATISLLTFYSSFVLRNKRRGITVGAIVTTLYAVLYFNLSSEDYALLIGSVLLFVALAVIMFVTRNVDWTAVGRPEQEAEKLP